MSEPSKRYGMPTRGVSFSDVSQAADAMLRSGERPTVEKVRFKIGGGSPNTLGPLLDRWWTTLASRLDAGPSAFHRLPESVAHISEALWVEALKEARERAALEVAGAERHNEREKDQLEVRSHVLSLREGELHARLEARDRRIADLEMTLRDERRNAAKVRAQAESLSRQLEELRITSVVRKTRRRIPASVRKPSIRQRGRGQPPSPSNLTRRKKPKVKRRAR